MPGATCRQALLARMLKCQRPDAFDTVVNELEVPQDIPSKESRETKWGEATSNHDVKLQGGNWRPGKGNVTRVQGLQDHSSRRSDLGDASRCQSQLGKDVLIHGRDRSSGINQREAYMRSGDRSPGKLKGVRQQVRYVDLDLESGTLYTQSFWISLPGLVYPGAAKDWHRESKREVGPARESVARRYAE